MVTHTTYCSAVTTMVISTRSWELNCLPLNPIRNYACLSNSNLLHNHNGESHHRC